MKKNFLLVSMFVFVLFVSPIIKYFLIWLVFFLAAPKWMITLLPLVHLLLVLAIVYTLFAKPLIIEAIKPQEYVPTNPDQFSELDVSSLQQYTEALESLGFVKLTDFTIVGSPSFARIFAHPEQYCFAEVSQIFLSGRKVMLMRVVICSYLEQNWSLSTTDRKISGFLGGILYMWRNRQGLWISQPELTPAELLQTHLQRLRRITKDLGITVLTDISIDSYLAYARQGEIKRKENIKRKNILVGLVEAWIFMVNPKHEWMGDYPKEAAKRI